MLDYWNAGILIGAEVPNLVPVQIKSKLQVHKQVLPDLPSVGSGRTVWNDCRK